MNATAPSFSPAAASARAPGPGPAPAPSPAPALDSVSFTAPEPQKVADVWEFYKHTILSNSLTLLKGCHPTLVREPVHGADLELVLIRRAAEYAAGVAYNGNLLVEGGPASDINRALALLLDVTARMLSEGFRSAWNDGNSHQMSRESRIAFGPRDQPTIPGSGSMPGSAGSQFDRNSMGTFDMPLFGPQEQFSSQGSRGPERGAEGESGQQ